MAQGQSTTAYAYDANNRLTAETKNTNGTNQTTKYTYDRNGNQLTKSINGASPDSYAYDEFDRLDNAVVNGQTIQYAYNADGLRISKTVGGVTTKQYWDGTNIVNEADQNGNLKNTYIRGTSLIGVIDASGSKKKYLFNGHGDVVGLADANGNVTKSYDYDIFGNEKNIDPKDTNPFRYVGEYYDNETGDYYLRARYYNPADGRFISEDTYEGDVKDPLSLNWYTYCEDDPVNGVDPSGHIPTAKEAAAMASHMYGVVKRKDKTLGGWVVKDIITNDESLKMAVYSRVKRDGKIEYALVNKGTSTFGDWINDFQQPVGCSDDMKDSIAQAKAFVKNHKSNEITFVGHSKGGAEAAANAVATNKNCIIFNPATVYLSEYNLSDDKYSAKMTAYIVKGEILNMIFNSVSTPIGKVVYLPSQSWNPLTNHRMSCVKKALEEK